MGSLKTSKNRGSAVRKRARGVFSGLKIRKKLIVLHTSFSLALGVLLLVALAPAMGKMVDGAEQDQSELIYRQIVERSGLNDFDPGLVQVRIGDSTALGLSHLEAAHILESETPNVLLRGDSFGGGVIGFDQTTQQFCEVRTRSLRARTTVKLIYGLVIVTLFAGYALVAVALEVLVLPQHVYGPIRAMLDADDAVQSKDTENEQIPEELISADELGEIMRSRNETVGRLRSHERELAEALGRLEAVAIDLHKKNRLLETARKNLEGADRLASLGMMSAGIAHELNTPLSVVKGLVGQLNERGTLSGSEIQLLVRVVGRLETLSEGLLDFARVRTPRLVETAIRDVIEDAWVLIKLDRQSVLPGQRIEFVDEVNPEMFIACDPGRLVQVFVNLIRNSVHALRTLDDHDGRVCVSASRETREDGEWVVISILDNGPGIDPGMIDSIFDPFVSTRLDAQGTGLGLAVADGIVREHGGVVVPSNLERDEGDGSRMGGAMFEVHLPVSGLETQISD
tara:strand:- start:53153 stop:54688 length:1536 start_codon:yes stop_codon:yes gene_type:complete